MSNQQEILDSLPPRFRASPEYQEFARVQGIFFDWMEKATDDVLNQFFIDEATWGLDIYEKEFGLAKPALLYPEYPFITEFQTVLSYAPKYKPLEERRAVIRAKKRGIGVVRATLIKEVAESFENGAVEVKAIQAGSIAEIKFIDTLGIPSNLEDMKKAIMEILPLNYTAEFSFRYLLIKDIDGVKTLAEMDALPLNLFAGGE